MTEIACFMIKIKYEIYWNKITFKCVFWKIADLELEMIERYEDSKTLSVCPYPEKRNHPSLVNISPTLVIDTSMERSSRVLHHGNPKELILFKKKKGWNWILTSAEIILASSISVLH